MSDRESHKPRVAIGLSQSDIARLAHGQSFVIETGEASVRVEPEVEVDPVEAAHHAGRLFHTIADKIEDETEVRDE